MSRLVLFVCTGNICRSPMAQALFNARAAEQNEGSEWVARSAGTWASETQPATPDAVSVMNRFGLELNTHQGHQITLADMQLADVVIVMTRNHRDALAAEFPQHRHKIRLMSELDGKVFDIADPYGGPFPGYELCAQELRSLIDSGYDRIKQWANHPPP